MNATAELDKGVTLNTIRLMVAKQVMSDTELTDLQVARPWAPPTHSSLPPFSAVCFLFAEYLQPHLNYPIGLVGTYWGGTRIEAWSPPEASVTCPIAPLPESLPAKNYPQQLWNSMVSPLLPMTITGALWYQGEGNAGRATEYSCQMPALVREWRSQFHQQSLAETRDDFPFGYVQLADLTNITAVGSFPKLRWAQTANHGYSPNTDLPNTFMAVAMDLPDFDSPSGAIHGRYKQEVADRLVLGALHAAYVQTDVVFQGPFPSSFSLDPADHSLTVQYDVNTLSSLDIRTNHGFDVCCRNQATCNGHAEWVEVPITNHDQTHVTLDVSVCESRGEVKGVRYAWRASPCGLKQCAVYDTDSGLPAPPFVQLLSSASGIIG